MRQPLCLPCLLLAFTLSAAAQHPAKPTASSRIAAAHSESDAAQLPVTRVSLYKNGVGFFEHTGHVTGNQSVTIDFTTAQLNDVLQSLTAVDLGGGRIAGADYNSTTPLEQQLKALPLALGEDATAVDFYNAIRGARVEVHGAGAAITGRLLNIEVPTTPGKDNAPAAEKRMITVVGDAGEVRTIELTSATEVRLLDNGLHGDVNRYLELLASTRNQGLRHLTLADNGTGTRELHVSYISEVPIWKSTYRILFSEPKPGSTANQTATLQGWSVVDNTTGADWVNVQLSLIAGAPQSFIQPLSVPYYSRRPEIGLPQEAQLTPQTHESGEEDKSAPAMAGLQGSAMGYGSGSGMAAGVGGNYGGGRRKVDSVDQTVAVAALPMSETSGATLGGSLDNELYQNLAANSVAPGSTTASFDDYFAYNLTQPITIRKNESAMVPILQTKVDAERVTLWSPREPTPLRALWITNTSNLTLDRGSFSIVENGNFAGEGLLDPIHPAERRLLSYAVDQAVRVTTEDQHDTVHANRLTSEKGVLVLHETQLADVTYVVHNAAADARTVVIEHPIRQNYILENGRIHSNTDPKPDEVTPSVYRFRVKPAAGDTVRLHVAEYHSTVVRYQLTSFTDNQLTFILNQTNDSPSIKHALEPILDARRHVADMQSAVDKVNARLKDLRSDEDRQRSNITALAGADKDSRERFVRDLNSTEDQIAAAQKELATAQANLQSAKDALASQIEAIQIDEKI